MQLNTVVRENILLSGFCTSEGPLHIYDHVSPRKFFGQLIIGLHGAKVRLHGLTPKLSACRASQAPCIHIVSEGLPEGSPPDHLEGV